MSKSINRKGIGRCVNCGKLFAAGFNSKNEMYIMGAGKCRSCGSTDYKMLNPEDIGAIE